MPISTVKVTVNGTTVNATSNGDGTYTATMAAPNVTSYNVNAGHYYPITVVATNTAGTATTVNDQTANLGTSLRLRVLEKTAPWILVSTPTNGQYFDTASPLISFSTGDDTAANGSGVDISTLRIVLDGKTYTNTSTEFEVTAISNGRGYQVKSKNLNLTDGQHTITISVSDNDGNVATTNTTTFTTDTVAPTLSVTNPAESGGYVSNASLTVTGSTSDSTSGAPTVKITLNGTDQGAVTVSNGAFSKGITLTNGSNTIVVTATDKAGRVTTITRTITLDTSSPVIASVVVDPNPVNIGENYVVTIKVTG